MEADDAIHATLRDLAGATSEHPRLLEVIARQLAELVDGFCAVGLISADRVWLEPIAVHDADPVAGEVLTRLILDRPVRLDSESGRLLGLDSVEPTLIPRFTPEQLRERVDRVEDVDALLAVEFGGFLAVPLRAYGEVIGAVYLARHGAGAAPIDALETQRLRNLADHAALALATSRLIVAWKRQTDQLRACADATRAFAASIEAPDRLFDTVVRRVAEILACLCSVRLLTPDRSKFSPDGAVHHPDPEVSQLFLGLLAAASQKVGEGISGTVALTGKTVFLPSIEAKHLARMAPSFANMIEKLGFRSVISVPLVADGELLGVLTLARDGQHAPFDEIELTVAESLAGHAALAVRNSLLFRSIGRAEARIREAEKMEAVGHLAGGVAHDFNNILTVINCYSALLIGNLREGDPMRDDLQEILTAGERAERLTSQLLAFSRRQMLEPRVVILDTIVRRMEPMLRRLLGEDIELMVAATAARVPTKVDPTQIEQILLNLAVNARDAMPQGGMLTIETQDVELDADYAGSHPEVVPGPHVMLAVSDNGTGMDAATQARIFEPFFTTKLSGRGTGLGLATIHGIVKQSRGSIWLYSEVGRGTTFKLYFPSATDAVVDVERVPKVTVEGGQETILLVEDEDQLRRLLAGLLIQAGYHVLSAANAGEALLVSEQHRATIHLLLTDVIMPRLSGRQLADRLALPRPDIKVLFMSGYADKAIVHHGVIDSDVNFLAKPITRVTLLRKVREVLDGGT